MRSVFFILCFFALNILSAQSIEVQGKVEDKETGFPVEYAEVLAITPKGEVLSSTTTNADGFFMLGVNTVNFEVKITYLEQKPMIVKKVLVNNGKADLGTIYLKNKSIQLDDVEAKGERSFMEFKMDKRVFNVGADLSSVGASALDVLNNVPSVSVSIEGEISLRGSTGVQVLINGKPSVLSDEESGALGTITADMIEKIEVITNPSAKYNAEGTAGIINIVLKKNNKKGLNGSITLNTGIPDNHSVGVSLSKRTEKFNLFSQLGIGHRSLPMELTNINQTFSSSTVLESDGDGDKNETFYNVILGTDHHFNPYNTLTLSGHFAYEKEKENTDIDYSQYVDNALTSAWNRTETSRATNPKWEYELQYKKEFRDDKEHQLLFGATGNFFGKDKSSYFESDATSAVPQRSKTDFKEAEFSYNLDYTQVFSEVYTLESGLVYQINDLTNDYEVSDLSNGDWVADSDLTNVFDYNQKVFGAYSSLGYEGKIWGVKAGLRMENTQLKTELENTQEKNNQNYTDLFPSVHTSYKVNKKIQLQLGYSRRISRPRMWDLNPFFSISDSYNIYTGNPNLNPEYSNSYEFTGIYKLGKNALNFSIYHRYTTDVIERVITFEDNVTTTQPQNIGSNAATGFEFNGKYAPAKWLSFSGDFNFNYFDRKGEYNDESFDFSGGRWQSRLTAKMKLPAKVDFEVSGDYRSKYKTYQSVSAQSVFMNLGLRKKILKGKGVFNLSVRDVFASRRRESYSSTSSYYVFSRRQRGRFFGFGFSYGFGKGEAMEFSGRKRF